MKKTILYIVAVTAVALILAVSVFASVEDEMYNGFKECREEIDISAYSINKNDFLPILNHVLNANYDLFYVSEKCQYSYNEAGYIVTLFPTYEFTGSELTSARKAVDSYIDSITSGVSKSWSTVEKLLYVHDAIVTSAAYDTSGAISDIYVLASKGKGICTAYTAAMLGACKKLGIEADVAMSDIINHIWCVVRVDGEWYHIDATWDDTVPDMKGRALHNNFLLSDSAIVNSGSERRMSWTCNHKCTSKKYDSSTWGVVTSQFAFDGKNVYAVDGDNFNVCKFDSKNGNFTVLARIEEKWSAPGGRYTKSFASAYVYNGYIYYNGPDTIYRYGLDSGEIEKVADIDTSSGEIYYFTASGKTLTYYLAEGPNAAKSTKGTINLDSVTVDKTYTVTYTVNGTVYDTQKYHAGDKITPPSSPKLDGFKFESWDSLPSKMPDKDITVKAVLSSVSCDHKETKTRTAKEATCTENGIIETYCTECGLVISTTDIPAEHKPGAWRIAIAASCVGEGLREHVCSVCGEVLEDEIISPTGVHDYSEWQTDESGRFRICSVCGNIEREDTDTDPLDTEADTSKDTAGDTEPADTEAIPADTEKSGDDTSPATPVSTDVDDGLDSSDGEGKDKDDDSRDRTSPSAKTIAVYVGIVLVTGAVNGSLIYLIVKNSKKRKKIKKD